MTKRLGKRGKELILRVNGSYPLKFGWGWRCGDEQVGGLGIIVGQLCDRNTPIKKMVFYAGGVMNRKNARKLMEFIKKNLEEL